jgi:DNA-binding transcriptional regulator YdaS (Cro superfamily)
MESTSTPREALKRACVKAGNQTELALKLGRQKAAVSRWMRERVPAEVCPDIERLTGVRCEELRPDVAWDVLRKARAA